MFLSTEFQKCELLVFIRPNTINDLTNITDIYLHGKIYYFAASLTSKELWQHSFEARILPESRRESSVASFSQIGMEHTPVLGRIRSKNKV